MLVFVTSIRHPSNSNDFSVVERIFEATLRSVCAQTDDDFRVVVTCNSVPQVGFSDPRVIYHTVDYPAPPPAERGNVASQPLRRRDKGTKLLAAMLRGREFNPDYYMILDADDLVSRNIASYVNAHPGTTGWYVDAGYALNFATGRIQRKFGLIRFCGTTLILNADKILSLLNMEESLSADCTQADMLERAPDYFIDHVIGNHPYTVKRLSLNGLHLAPLPLRAVAWVQAHGENSMIHEGTPMGVPLTQAFIEEFGVPHDVRGAHSATTRERLAESFDHARSWAGFQLARIIGHPDVPGVSKDTRP